MKYHASEGVAILYALVMTDRFSVGLCGGFQFNFIELVYY